MDNNDLIKWFKLCTLKGLGPRRIIKLFECFDGINAIWNTSSDELLRSRIFKDQMIPEWQKLKDASSDNFKKIIDECKQNNIFIIPIISSEYPIRLKMMPNPPLNLFLQGDKELLQTKKVAIVGSRQSDEQSKKWAFQQSMNIVKQNITVISGGAIGIDYEAHKGALEASGKTICVMGPGLLRLYPEDHIPLFNEIRKKGLLISEHTPRFPGSKIALLQRNRITSGLSDALVSVTASIGGGVMTQLKHAHDQRIPIFCPKFSFNFSPMEGLKAKKQEYGITEIDNIDLVLELIGKNIISRQNVLF